MVYYDVGVFGVVYELCGFVECWVGEIGLLFWGVYDDFCGDCECFVWGVIVYLDVFGGLVDYFEVVGGLIVGDDFVVEYVECDFFGIVYCCIEVVCCVMYVWV